MLLLYSGGLDSTVLLYNLIKDHDIECLYIDYGSRHYDKEFNAAIEITNILKVKLHFFSVRQLYSNIKNCSLLEFGPQIPEVHYEDPIAKSTIVPFRNGLLLSIATVVAINNYHDIIVYGAHFGDRTIYPDCRFEFIDAMNHAIGLCNSVKIETPFIGMKKSEIVKLGYSLNVPFSKTWSCYNNRQFHCGNCPACIERNEAFEKQ